MIKTQNERNERNDNKERNDQGIRCVDYTYADDLCDSHNDEINLNNKDNINGNIYRFKFTEEFTNELYKFSKIHQYDERKDFKEAWGKWVEEQDMIVATEVRRLTNLGYNGNILDKMFKSARYYFRKKNIQKKEPVKRRIYQGSQKEILEAMDEHIKGHINDKYFKPSDGFDSFCKEYLDFIKQEVNFLCQNGYKDPNEIKNKIKKTYKNRYFLLNK
jgi:hypothetical protein